MANELAIKVKVELDTSKKALDQQFNKIKEQYDKTPVKIAFTANVSKTRTNINNALKELIGKDQIKVPEIALKFKVNGKEVSSQIKAAIESAGKELGDTTSKVSKDFQSQFNKLFTLKKSLSNLEISKINTDPNSEIVLQELDKQIADTTSKYEALKQALAGKIDDAAMKEFLRQEKELNDSLQNTQNLARARIQQQEKDQKTSYDHISASIKNLINTMNIYRDQVETFQKDTQNSLNTNVFDKLSESFDTTLSSDGFKNQTEQLRALQDITTSANQELRRLKSRVVEVNKATRESTGFSNLSSQIRDFIDSTPRLKENTDLYQRFLDLLKKSDNEAGNIDVLRKSFAELRNDTKKLGLESETTYGKLSKLFSEHFQTALVMAGIHGIQQGLRMVYENVVEIDSAMTELKKVTDETDTTYNKFLDGAASKARELGASISDYISSTAEWARLGYQLDDAEELARVSTLYYNIGDGIDSATQASEYLISTLRGFGLLADDAEHVLDVINEVANTQPVSERGLGEILTRASAAMDAANNSFEETVALGTAMNSVLQDEEKVGTTLKTVSMYLRAAKTDAEEAGIATDGMASSVSELRGELLTLTNQKVDIMADETTFKSTYQIMKELANVWEDLSDIDQANILEMLGGKRNANAVQALLNNFSIAESSLESAMNSTGSAVKENERYLDSISGRIAQLNAAFEQLSTTLLDSGVVKGLVSFATGIIDAANAVVELTGVLPILISSLTTIVSFKADGFNLFSSMDGTIEGLKKAASTLSKLPSVMQSLQAFGANKIIISSSNDVDILSKALDGLSDSEKEAALHLLKFNAGSKEANSALLTQLSSTLGLTTATKAATVAQAAWNSVLIVGRSLLLGLGIGAAVIVIQKLVGAVNDWIHAQEKAEEAVQNSSEEVKSATESLTSLNNELEDTKKKIEEIQNKDVLSITDKQDLENLKEQNQQLEMQIALEELKRKNAEKKLEQDTNDLVQKTYGNSVPNISAGDINQKVANMDGILNPNDAVLQTVNGDLEETLTLYGKFIDLRDEAYNSGDTDLYSRYDEQITKLNDDLIEQVENLQEIKEAYDTIGYENLGEDAQEYYDSISESLSTVLYYLDRVSAFNLISNDAQFTEAKNELKNYVQETGADFEQLRDHLDNDLYSDAIEKYVAALQNAGFTTSEIAAGIIDSIGAAGDSLDQYSGQMTDLNNKLDEIQSAYQSVRGAIDEYNEKGILSADTIQTLMGLSPQYTQYLFNEQGQLEINSGTLEQVRQGYISLTDAVYDQCKALELEKALRAVKSITDTETASNYLSQAEDIQAQVSTTDEMLRQLEVAVAEARRQATSTADSEYTVQMEEAWGNILKTTRQTLSMWDQLKEATHKNTDAALGYQKQQKNNQKQTEKSKDAMFDALGAWDTLKSAMEEYNSSGQITYKTLESLISLYPKFTKCLSKTDDGLVINTSTFRDLIDEQLAYAVSTEDATNNVDELARMSEWLSNNVDKETISFNELLRAIEGVDAEMDAAQEKAQNFGSALNTGITAVFGRNKNNLFTQEELDQLIDMQQALKEYGEIVSYSPETKEFSIDIEALRTQVVKDLQAQIDAAKAAGDELTATVLEQTKTSIENKTQSVTDYLLGLGETFQLISDEMDDFQSGYQDLIGIVDEYNKHHELSQDSWQAILTMSPEYLKCLELEGNRLVFNKEAFKELYIAAIQARIATLSTDEANKDLVAGLQKLIEGLKDTDFHFDSSTDRVQQFKDALSDLTTIIDTVLGKLQDNLDDQSNKLQIWGDAIQNEIDNRISKLEEEKELQDEMYENEIQDLEDKKEALQEANDEQERAIKLAELQDALAKAKANKTVRKYVEGQGYIWTTDDKAIHDAEQELSDQIRDWNKEDASAAIDDQIDAIKDQQEEAQKVIDAEIDKLNELKDKYAEIIDLIGMSWDDYQEMLKAQAAAQGMTYDDMVTNLTDYKDSVISNMKEIQQITDITETIDQIQEIISLIETAFDFLDKVTTIAGFLKTLFGGGGENGAPGVFETIINGGKALFDKLSSGFSSLGNTIKTIAGSIASFFVDGATGIWAAITNGANNLFNNLVGSNGIFSNIATGITNVAGAIKDLFNGGTGVWEAIKLGASNFISGLGNIFSSGLPSILQNLVSSLTNSFGGLWSNLLTGASGLIGNLTNMFGGLGTTISGILSTASGALGSLAPVIGIGAAAVAGNAAIEWGSNKANEKFDEAVENNDTLGQIGWGVVSSALNGIRSPISSIINGIKGIGKLLGFASGTRSVPASGLYNVDEKGSEIIVRKPSSGRYTYLENGDGVIPADITNRLFEMGSNPNKWFERQIKDYDLSHLKNGATISTSISIGDIKIQNPVGDVDQLALAIKQQLPNRMSQELGKR